MKVRCGRRQLAVLCAGALMYALMYALGSQIDAGGETEPVRTLVRFVLALPAAGAVLFALLEGALPLLGRREAKDGMEKPFCLPGAFFLILFCFVPMFLIQYPGSFVYDTQRQVFQVALGEYDAFHPLLHTLLLGMCLSAYDILQSLERCAALYSVIQMTLMAGCFALTCASLSRSCSRRVARAATAFFCLYPAHMAFASNCTKDGLFAAFFALFTAYCLEAVRSPGMSRRRRAMLVLSGVLSCLMRNNMIYAMAAWLILLLIGHRRFGRLAVCALLVIVTAFGVNKGLIAATGAENGSVGEMLCVPMQQLARAYRYANACFTQEDQETLDVLFDRQSYMAYDPTLADPVKQWLNVDELEADPMRALELWLSVGRQCPGIYLDAFLNTALPFLYPYGEYRVSAPYIETGLQNGVLTAPYGQDPIQQPRRFEAIRNWLYEHIWATGADEIPVVRWLFNSGAIVWLMLFCVLRAAYAGDWAAFGVFLLAVMLWGTYLLGPIMQGRYLYPFVCMLPALLGSFGGCKRKDDRQIIKEERKYGV